MAHSVVTAILKSTIGWLSEKGLNVSAEELNKKDGVIDRQLCSLIARELKGAVLNDSLEEIIDLYSSGVRIISFADLEVKAENGIDVNSRATVGSDAKRLFEQAREKAAIVFDESNGSLATADRLLAIYFFVKATLFEQMDFPEDALASCIQCLEGMHSMKEVENSFSLELRKVPLNCSRNKVYNPAQVISSVRRINQVVFDVTQLVGTGKQPVIWPSVTIGRDRIYPLDELRLGKKLRDQKKDVCSEKWSFGQFGESGTKQDLMLPSGIATNSEGHFLVTDVTKTKVYDNSGNYLHSISLPKDVQFRQFEQPTDEEFVIGDNQVFHDDPYVYDILDIDTDREDNVYLLVSIVRERDHNASKKHWYQVLVFDKEFSQRRDRTFKLKDNSKGRKLTVRSYGGKLEVLVLEGGKDEHAIVETYNAEAGTFVCCLGDRVLMDAQDVTAASNGHVYVLDKFHDDDAGKCVHEFSGERKLVRSFGVDPDSVAIAFDETNEHIVIVSSFYDLENCRFEQNVSVYDSRSIVSDNSYIDSKLLRTYEVDAGNIPLNLSISLSPGGLIAVALAQDFSGEVRGKVVVMRDTKGG